MAFSCGARSAFKLKGKGYLRNMLSRRQLQGLLGFARLNDSFRLILSLDLIDVEAKPRI